VSGLEGDLWRVPTIGVSVGISSIAEFQIDGGPFNHLGIRHRNPAPLSHLLTVTGKSTSDFQDIVIGTKIRLLAEAPKHPSLAFRFATKLPNTKNEKGLASIRRISTRRCSSRKPCSRSGSSATAASAFFQIRRLAIARTTC
jgi:hypothetical protein